MNKKPIILFGAGGHGRSVADVVESEGKYRIVGWIDSKRKPGEYFSGYKVLGNEQSLPCIIKKSRVSRFVIALGDNYQRMKVTNRICSIIPRARFVTSIHHSAVISPSASIASGVVVMPNAIIHAHSSIEEGCLINTGASIDHDGYMEAFSSLAPGAVLGGNVQIGTCSAVGLGASVIQKVRIGRHTVIGAGSVVVRDIPDEVVAFGNPCSVQRKRNIDEAYL